MGTRGRTWVVVMVVVAMSVVVGSGSTQAVDTAPFAPTNVRWAVVQSPVVELTWAVPAGTTPIAGYAVYRNGVEVPSTTLASPRAGEVSVSLGAQPTGRDLFLQVQAIATSGLRSVKTAPVVVNVDGTRPTVPTNLASTTQANGQPLLTWSPSTDPVGPVSYVVYRNGAAVRTTTSTSAAFDAEPAAVDIFFQVQARDPSGNASAKTAPIVVRLPGPDTIRPTIPTGVTPVLRLNATVELSWTPSTDNVGVVGYSVFVNGVEVTQTTERSVRLLNQPRGVTLGYQVQAYDAAGNRSAKTVPVYLAF